MATIRAYTSVEQSRKLAEILPLESADTLHCIDFDGDLLSTIPKQYSGSFRYQPELIIPCWSLAALLGVLPRETRLLKSATDDIYYHCDCPKGNVDKWFDNPVDACYEMILKLHELKML